MRLAHPSLPDTRSDEVADAVESGLLFASLPFLLEAGYSARNAQEHRELIQELGALPWAAIDEEVEKRAIEVQGQLARTEHHRMPPVDVLIAALAERHELGVLHYDHDYDLLASKTDLLFSSVWLAKPGLL
jgi:predicted nucleic acid-binding protein